MPRKIVARKSAIHGNGVFALQPIARGERVIEYKGRRRTHEEVDAGDTGGVESGHTFLFTLNDDYVIDANYEGGQRRRGQQQDREQAAERAHRRRTGEGPREASRPRAARRMAKVIPTFGAAGASAGARQRARSALPGLSARSAGRVQSLRGFFGLSMVPVHLRAPQRQAQIFFRRAVCGSSRVMP